MNRNDKKKTYAKRQVKRAGETQKGRFHPKDVSNVFRPHYTRGIQKAF